MSGHRVALLIPGLLTAFSLLGCKSTPVDISRAERVKPRPKRAGAKPDRITAKEKVWTWIPFENARCANNTPTGIGVNINKRSDRLLIYLQGGGACWDHRSCNASRPMARNLDGYGADDFKGHRFALQGIFDRQAKNNPFRDWSFVYIPYCTGDIHGGNGYSKATGKHHVGRINMAHYLKRLVPTFSTVSEVLLVGTSAGGFGAVLNYHHVQLAFGSTPVHLLDDSAPFLAEGYLKPKLQNAWRTAWNLDATLPPGCAKCRTGGLHNLMTYLARTYPRRRFGLISSRRDLVIRKYFGLGYSPEEKMMPVADFEAGLDHLAREVLGPYKNWRVYQVRGPWHVFLNRVTLATTRVSGVRMSDWIRDLAVGASGWSDVSP
jgi:hypothetical protein